MSNFVVKDTTVSDSALASVLTGSGVRELMLDGATSNVTLPTLSNGNTTLSTSQWIEATIRNLLLNSDSLTSAVSASTSTLVLGSGVAQAAAYVNFFNLGSGQSRFVRLGPVTTRGNASVQLGGADAAGFVDVTSGGIGGSVAASGALFNTGSSNVVRNVQVYCANPNASSARVIFNIL